MFDAFWALSGQRSYNMGGPNPISIADMVALLDGIGIKSFESRETYIAAWMAMDRAFIGYTVMRAKNNPQPEEE